YKRLLASSALTKLDDSKNNSSSSVVAPQAPLGGKSLSSTDPAEDQAILASTRPHRNNYTRDEDFLFDYWLCELARDFCDIYT
ncbi:unnamed protein product, partial [Amoebophrya sp. A25]